MLTVTFLRIFEADRQRLFKVSHSAKIHFAQFALLMHYTYINICVSCATLHRSKGVHCGKKG